MRVVFRASDFGLLSAFGVRPSDLDVEAHFCNSLQLARPGLGWPGGRRITFSEHRDVLPCFFDPFEKD
jgi:hypothetical protein